MMSTDLSPEQNDYIDFLVSTGKFPSREAALDEAIHLLQERELKQRIDKGIQEIESGQGIYLNSDEELRQFFENIKRESRERASVKPADKSCAVTRSPRARRLI